MSRWTGALILLAACATEASFADVEQQGGCPYYACGNSQEIAHNGLWEANIFGERDVNGVAIKTLTKSGRAMITKDHVEYALYVSNGRIIGSAQGYPPLVGAALAGARIEMWKNGAPSFDIVITKVRPEGTAFALGAPNPIETYTMLWTEPGASTGKPFCNDILDATTDAKAFELFGLLPGEAIAFEGDRVDIGPKTMSVVADDNWFNFGCAGHTLAKLYITRNTAHTQPIEDWAQRQSVLKMFVGDYCGTGQPFTLAGEPIVWKGGLMTDYWATAVLTDHEKPLDARWNEKGASCFYEPRMQESSNPLAAELFPDARKQITDACPALRVCDNDDPQDIDGQRVISANRIPLP